MNQERRGLMGAILGFLGYGVASVIARWREKIGIA